LAVGEADVDALLERIPSRLLSEWMAYYSIEPFGEARTNYLLAILASLLANMQRDPKKRREPFEPQDFLPELNSTDEEEPHQTWEQQKALLHALLPGTRTNGPGTGKKKI
jgi:superfamily I DNA/RNA helicase